MIDEDELLLRLLEMLHALSAEEGWYVPGPFGLLTVEHDPWEAERRSIAYAMGDMPVEDVMRSL